MNTEKKRHSKPWKWLRIIAWGIAALALLLLALRLSLKSRVVQNWVKSYAVTTANESLTAHLQIQNLKGDLWKEITVSGISLTGKDTLAQVDSVHVSYDILSLLGDRFEILQLDIYRPALKLRQKQGEWNFANLVKPSPDTTATDTSGGFPFQIEHFILHDGSASVRGDSLPVESDFSVSNVVVRSSFGMDGSRFDLDLRELSFQINETRLESPLTVATSASASNKKITLKKLVLATGNSMIRSTGYFNQADSSVAVDLSAVPASWKDAARYVGKFPLREDVRVDLGVKGRLRDFQVQLNVHTGGLQKLALHSRFLWDTTLTIPNLELRADYINPAEFVPDSELPSLQNLHIQFAGAAKAGDYRQSHGNVRFSADHIRRGTYQLDAASGKLSLRDDRSVIQLQARQGKQDLSSEVTVDDVWSELPEISGTINGKNITLSRWMPDSSVTGTVTFTSTFSGRGWVPDSTLWDYSFRLTESRLMDQPITELSLKGKAGMQRATVDGKLRSRKSAVNLFANLRNLTTVPQYDFTLRTRNFNVGPFLQDSLSTAINASAEGRGQGFSPSAMQMQATVVIDSSIFNKESIERFTAQLAIEDTVAVLDSSELKSTIAEGAFEARMHLLKWYHPENQLSFDLEIKDIGTLAPVLNVQQVEAEGSLNGSLKPLQDEELEFTGAVDLSEVVWGETFTADQVNGSVNARWKQNPEFALDVNLDSPTFAGVQLQDFNLKTRGTRRGETTRGSVELTFSSTTEGSIAQVGRYTYSADSVAVRTTHLDIVSSARTLRLQKPFTITVANNVVQMDTLHVASDDSAFVEIAVPFAGAKRQEGFIKGKALNLTVIQETLFGKAYVEGVLSGQFEVARADTNLKARGELLLSQMEYDGMQVDTFLLKSDTHDGRLQGSLTVSDRGTRLFYGTADLPFRLGDPAELPESFFEEPVSGKFIMRKISMERFQALFEKAGLTDTKGILTFNGTLEGTAGSPSFAAKAVLDSAELSGVTVDSVTASVNYQHEESKLDLEGRILSLRQDAARVKAEIPFYADLRKLEINPPEKNDQILVDIQTNDFNLAAINDFVNETLVREVEGELNGNVRIKGAVNDLKTGGELTLREGAFRLVPAGIRIENIRSIVALEPNQLRIDNLTGESGKGDLQISGAVGLKKLVPGDIDLQVSADNFKAANTAQYNAIINMNAEAHGSFMKPEISGSLSFISGFFEMQNFGDKSIENVQLDSVQVEGPNYSLYDSLSLDMNVSFDERFFVRNERYLEMQVELDGEVDLQKQRGEELQLFGTINTAGGYARPLGKQFEIEEGSVMFSGEPANPQLSVRTLYEPPETQDEIRIWYIIEGTVEDPKFKYESEPPMKLENIISYTLFGQPFYALDSWKQVVANSGSNASAADVALDVLLDRVEALATRKLGIDVVKIDNTTTGTQTGTSITTGWYINPKVFFAIQNVITGSSPDTGFLLEYKLQKNLKLILRQGYGIRQGVDVRWNYDY